MHRQLLDGEAIEIRFRKAGTNEQVGEIEGSKMPGGGKKEHF